MTAHAALLEHATTRRSSHAGHLPAIRDFLSDPKARHLDVLGVKPNQMTGLIRQVAAVETLAEAGLTTVQVEGGCALIRRVWVPVLRRTEAEQLSALKGRVADLLRAIDAGMIDLGASGDSLIDAIRVEMGAD